MAQVTTTLTPAEYRITTDDRGNEMIFNGSAEMVKQGQTWKIKEETIKWD